MALVVVKYIDGKPVYRDLGPANGASGPVRVTGSLVTAEPDWRDRKKLARDEPRLPSPTEPDTRPIRPGRPRKSALEVVLVGQGKRPGYATEEERIAARRQSWRESARRKRERAA